MNFIHVSIIIVVGLVVASTAPDKARLEARTVGDLTTLLEDICNSVPLRERVKGRSYFHCGFGRLIKTDCVCDGQMLCRDGSDEWNCTTTRPACSGKLKPHVHEHKYDSIKQL